MQQQLTTNAKVYSPVLISHVSDFPYHLLPWLNFSFATFAFGPLILSALSTAHPYLSVPVDTACTSCHTMNKDLAAVLIISSLLTNDSQ